MFFWLVFLKSTNIVFNRQKRHFGRSWRLITFFLLCYLFLCCQNSSNPTCIPIWNLNVRGAFSVQWLSSAVFVPRLFHVGQTARAGWSRVQKSQPCPFYPGRQQCKGAWQPTPWPSDTRWGWLMQISLECYWQFLRLMKTSKYCFCRSSTFKKFQKMQGKLNNLVQHDELPCFSSKICPPYIVDPCRFIWIQISLFILMDCIPKKFKTNQKCQIFPKM